MSSYLLLRNNKESGPFTIEEIQGLSLKAYDLIWVVGKSAAWRYPGEIQDFKSFAPPVPEQLTDFYLRKPDNKKSDTNGASIQESSQVKISESGRARENNGLRNSPARSVYVNLPADKKPASRHQDRIFFELEIPAAVQEEIDYGSSDLYKKEPSRDSRVYGKIFWVSTVILLFGTGIITGFFISDRRNFFSTAEKPTQKQEVNQSAPLTTPKDVAISGKSSDKPENRLIQTISTADSIKIAARLSDKSANGQRKKQGKMGIRKNDSALTLPVLTGSSALNDSPRQSILPKTDLLLQQIKTHPENYISLQSGRYSTGLFGGISSFSITLTNNSSVMLGLVVVSIDYIQNNEKIFKTENLSFNDLEPGESVTLKAPKSPRGVKIATHMQIMNSLQADPISPH